LAVTKNGRAQRLAKRLVETVAPESKRFVIWDDTLPGFGLRVEPTGRKTFIARYRAGGGRTGVLRQATVGRLGTVTLDQARSKAKALIGAAQGGADPLGERKRARQAGLSVGEVCDWYLTEASKGRLLGRKGRSIKASTLAMDRSRIETHVKPLIGKKSVANIEKRDLEQMQADIAAGRTARAVKGGKKRPRGGLATGGSGVASRTLGMLISIFAHAEHAGIIAVHPGRGARKLAGSRKRARLSIEQISALGTAMREAADENPTAVAAIRLILMTGLRRLEALSLTPSQILPGGGVDLTDSKTGSQIRPVGKAALEAMKARIADNERSWLFPADRGEGHFVGLPKVLSRISDKAKLKGVTAHVLRHTFASVAGDLGYSELTIAGLLGHAAGSVTASYVHLDSALVVAADRVAGVIATTLDGRAGAEIVPLKVGNVS
jgi:integrase